MNDQLDDLDILDALGRAGRGPTASSRDAIRSTLAGDRGCAPVLQLVGDAPNRRRPNRSRTLVFAGAAIAAAAAIIAVVVVANGDDSAELVPATEVPLPDPSLPITPTTDPVDSISPTPTTPTTESATSNDVELLAELTGHRWIVTAVDGNPWTSGFTPFITFIVDSTNGASGVSVGGNDGCTSFGQSGSITNGAFQFTQMGLTEIDCGPGVGGITPAAGDLLRLGVDGTVLDFERSDGTVHLSYVRSDALIAATAADMVGRWTAGGNDDPLLVFRDGGVMSTGTCGFSWSLDGTLMVETPFADPDTCFGDSVVSGGYAYQRLADVLLEGNAVVTVGVSSETPMLYLTTEQSVVTLADADPVVDLGGITFTAATAFGFSPSQAVTPEDVLAVVEPVVGPVDHDTGWYNVPIVTYEDGSADCLTGRDFRVLWWGDFSTAFWRSPAGATGTDEYPATLWTWSIGDVRASNNGDRREIYMPPADSSSGLATESGIGVGSTEAEMLANYSGSLIGPMPLFEGPEPDPDDDGSMRYFSNDTFLPSASGIGASITTRDGLVTGIAATIQFC